MKTVRILIATTGGIVAIDRITAERAPQSMVCLKRTSQVLPISGAYDDFVRPGSGVIAREFGDQSFRLDLSAAVDSGESWQLAVFLAHAIWQSGSHELAGPDASAQQTFLVTGRVNYDLEIERVDHMDDKIKAAASVFQNADETIGVIVPAGDNADQAQALLNARGRHVYACACVADALAVIGAVAPMPPMEIPNVSAPTFERGWRWRSLGGAIIVMAVLFGVSLGTALWKQQDTNSVAAGAMPEKDAVGKADARVLGRVDVFGKYPPSGKQCASLLFSSTAPVLRAYRAGDERPCGFRLLITPALPARFVGVYLDQRSGRLIETASRVDELKGDRPVVSPLNIDLDLPLRQREAIDVQIVVVFGEHSVVALISRMRSNYQRSNEPKETDFEVVETRIELSR